MPRFTGIHPGEPMAYAAAMTEQNMQIRLASRPIGRPTATGGA
jgi:hypothetical protein